MAAPSDRAVGAGEVAAALAPRSLARIVRLEQGLYALSLDSIGGPKSRFSGMMLPAVQISPMPSDTLDPIELVASSGAIENWLDAEGDVVVVRSPLGGASALITIYEPPDQPAPLLRIGIRRLDPREHGSAAATHAAPAGAMPGGAMPGGATPREQIGGREIRTEIVAHIERLGDRQYPGAGQVGNRGDKLRIEAFSIRPLEGLLPADIEYMAYGPSQRETPWVSEGTLCGSRGRGLPLTGFAVRLSPAARDRFDVIYRGQFFSGAAAGPCRNGEPCTSAVLDDPLEAFEVHVVERAGR